VHAFIDWPQRAILVAIPIIPNQTYQKCNNEKTDFLVNGTMIQGYFVVLVDPGPGWAGPAPGSGPCANFRARAWAQALDPPKPKNTKKLIYFMGYFLWLGFRINSRF